VPALAGESASAPSSPRTLRIVHATDLHFLERPSLSDVLAGPKRIIGLTHLFVLGRASKFSRAVQDQLVDTISELKPDLLLLSGDLTTLALESEFATARRALHPLLDNNGAFPTLIVAGNHDAYTRGAVTQGLMQRYFGPWMQRMDLNEVQPWQWESSERPEQFRAQVERVQRHFAQFKPEASAAFATPVPHSATAASIAAASSAAVAATSAPLSSLPVFSLGFLRLLCLDPCRPTSIGSRGQYPTQQLRQLDKLLHQAPVPLPDATAPWRLSEKAAELSGSSSAAVALPLQSSYNVLVSHYPLLNGAGVGVPYESSRPWQESYWHGARNGGDLRALLLHPRLAVQPNMFLHGHVHRGYIDRLRLHGEDAGHSNELLSFDPGSGGQSFDVERRRCAAFNVYSITRLDSSDGRPASPGVLAFEQQAADGTRFRVQVERWLHDGTRFRPERPVPYTEGF